MEFFDKQKKFSRQISSAFLLGTIVLAAVSSLLVSFFSYQQERETYIDYGLQVSKSFLEQTKFRHAESIDGLVRYASDSLLKISGVKKIAVYDSDFNQLFIKGDAPEIPLIAGWQDIRLGNHVKFERETDLAYYYIAPVIDQEKNAIVAYGMIVFEKPTIEAFARSVILRNIITMVILAVILVFSLGIVIRRLTRPLEEFSSIMIQAESGQKGIRADHDSCEELAHMSHAFNQMMTEIERREIDLKLARDQAMHVAKAKSELAANVSHEIRTPLNGILGMVNLLREMGLPPHQQEYLEVASKSGESLLQMINDVLDFSKVESGNMELSLSDFDFRLHLEQLALLYAEKIQAKDLEICLDLPTDQALFVRGDAIKIRQIISNLLNNAVKFTKTGHITLHAKEVSRADKTILFEIVVRDTGVGIPEQAYHRIFQPFGQVSLSTSNDHGGTGLGLSIVEQMVALMDGEVSVSSKVGEGSAFKVLLPLHLHAMPPVLPSMENSQLVDKKLLFIDPFSETRNYVSRMLKSWGVECHVAENLNDAIVQLQFSGFTENTFDYCLFNYDEGGNELAKFIHLFSGDGRKSKTKFIPMIRFGARLTISKIDNTEFSTSLDRPIRYEKLRQTLLDVLSDKTADSVSLNQDKMDVLSGLKILVVDDNTTNQLVAQAMLNELGIVADVASNGLEALDAFKSYSYDLILMDCNMPIMDGYESTKNIRALGDNYAQPIIIALTAKDEKSELDQCLAIGMNDYLLKPFQLSSLSKSMEKALGERVVDNTADEEIEAAVNEEVIASSVFSTLALNTGSGLEKIVQSYFVDTPIYIATLIAAMEAANVSNVLELAHKIKGSSRNLGANEIVETCREIEAIWTESDVDSVAITLVSERLQREFAKVEKELEARLAASILPEESDKLTRVKEVVLVVDDDQSTRMTICTVLEREGYQVEQGTNGREAIKLFEALRPNAIIMDAMMPIKDGFQACKEIKAMEGGENVPILITTALESEKSVDKAFEYGAADFVPKPINLSVLRQRVRRLLEKQSADQHVQKLAYKDVLTGLPNRTSFVEQINQEIEHAERNNNTMALLFIDLDQFKHINDNLGHDAGDTLLKALAGRLSNCVRSSDMLARLGGDEFVVILSNVDSKNVAEKVASSMLSSLKDPFRIAGNEIFAGVSIGIATYPSDGLTKEDLLKNADTAMYKAKANGRNNYQFYDQEMSKNLAERMKLEAELRKVVEDEELALYYQPKQDTKTGKVIGSEALVRWNHQLQGIVSPDKFIPLAEETGLIKDIGMWVLDTACKTLKSWQVHHGYTGTVAVNVSAVQIMDEDFVNKVSGCLKKHQLEKGCIELEITESMVLDDVDVMLEKLHQLRRLGLGLSIDDFGTGYSSFNYLKQMPVHTLKLDREFINNLEDDKADRAIVDGMIVMAHNLDLKVVAEGVETQPQYDFLQKRKCDLIQGYLVSKPLAQNDFENKYVFETENVPA